MNPIHFSSRFESTMIDQGIDSTVTTSSLLGRNIRSNDHERIAPVGIETITAHGTMRATRSTLLSSSSAGQIIHRETFPLQHLQPPHQPLLQLQQHQSENYLDHRRLLNRREVVNLPSNVELPAAVRLAPSIPTSSATASTAPSAPTSATSSPTRSPVLDVPLRYFQSLATLNNLGTSKLKSGQMDDAIDYFDVVHASIVEIKSILIQEQRKSHPTTAPTTTHQEPEQEVQQLSQQQNQGHPPTRSQFRNVSVGTNNSVANDRFSGSSFNSWSSMSGSSSSRNTQDGSSGNASCSDDKNRQRRSGGTIQSPLLDSERLPKGRHELCYLKLELFLRHVTSGGRQVPPLTSSAERCFQSEKQSNYQQQQQQQQQDHNLPSSFYSSPSTSRFDCSVLLPSTYHTTLCATTEPVIVSANFLNTSFLSAAVQQLDQSINVKEAATEMDVDNHPCNTNASNHNPTNLRTNESTIGNTFGASLVPAIYIDSADLAGRYEELNLLSFIALYNWGVALYRKSYMCLILANEQLLPSNSNNVTNIPMANNTTSNNSNGSDTVLTKTVISVALYQLSKSFRVRSWDKFMEVLKSLETSIGLYRGGDIHFFHAVSVAKMVLRNSIQIAIDNQDTGLERSYTINYECASTIADVWYTSSIGFWGTSLLQRRLAGAA